MSGSTMAPKVNPISDSMWRNVPILRAIGQKATEVVLREPGQRLLGAPKTFAPAFRDALNLWAQRIPAARLSSLELFPTGHSLGGGLAQQFAYALPHESVKHVKKVFAFDPSPVTGFYSVPRKLRDENKKGLSIDRIYERGEVLALLRSLTSLFYKPSARNAEIRGVRYRLFHAWKGVAAHSIDKLAVKLGGARA